MDQYVTGSVIKKLREQKNLTQNELAEILGVSDKTVSKWETGKGFPDISFLDPLSKALGISIIELLSGNDITNTNRSSNMNRMKFHVCPVCTNLITSTGNAVISCCGITLPPLEPEEQDDGHEINIQTVDNELYVTMNHEMSKDHYISFIALVKQNSIELVKQYPEQEAQAYFRYARTGKIIAFCNHHGLFEKKI